MTGDGHPEQPKRVIAIKEKLKKKKRSDLEKTRPGARKNIGYDAFDRLH